MGNIAFEGPDFFKNNEVQVIFKDTERNLDLNMNWDMDKFPGIGLVKVTAVGRSPRLGDFSANKNLNWNTDGDKVDLDLNGNSQFGEGILANFSPIVTMVDVSYDYQALDLVGKVSKVMAGKEYSITFPVGSGITNI